MKNEINKETSDTNKIEFNPKKINTEYILLEDLNKLEFDEEEILQVFDLYDEWNKFFTEKEYQTLLEEYIDIKRSNINSVSSNPLYFIKKIVYFYNKETFFDSFLLKLKNPPNSKKMQTNKDTKSISFKAKFNNEDKKALLNLDLENKICNGKIKPDNKDISIPFDVGVNNNIIFHINKYDENKIEINLVPKLIQKGSKKYIKKSNYDNNNNKTIQSNNITDNNMEFPPKKNLLDSLNQNEANNSNSNTSISKKDNYSSEILSKDETLISYDEKESENFKILIKENNDNLLNDFHREKLEGTTYESIANKTFELLCNLAINRNIDVKNYPTKKAKKINIFFNLNKENKVKDFQIDSYISKLTGKEFKKIKEKFPNNFFFFEDLNLIDSENYEIIGEISQNIINNSRQKISQEFNYIHLIKEFNKYAKKEDSNFISLCNEYGFNNNEKIFILITDGSYIRTKYLINVLINKKSEIEKLISQKKEKTEIINVLSGYFNDNSTLDLLEINIERFYNFCLFYYNLKESGIKFCFCFISDIIEDKLENILEEKIKLYKDYDKDLEKKIDLKDESEKKKPKNEFIEKIAETLEKNNKLKSNLMIIKKMMIHFLIFQQC